jgi:pimeloyl-ACP methyl ester carboxylesterase
MIGFGRTRCPGPIPSIAQLAGILERWMGNLGLDSAHIAGHSMGGQIAVHLAARYPERVERLVLVDSAGLHPAPTARTVARFAADILPPVRWGDPTFLPIILRDSLRAGPRSITRSLAHILTENVAPLLHQIAAPTLVLWGRRDSFVPLAHAHEFRARIPDAQLVVLDRAAHNPMVDCPAEFNRVVRRFLRGERVGE